MLQKKCENIIRVNPKNLLEGDECWILPRGGLEMRCLRRTANGLLHWKTLFFDRPFASTWDDGKGRFTGDDRNVQGQALVHKHFSMVLTKCPWHGYGEPMEHPDDCPCVWCNELKEVYAYKIKE